MGIKARFDYLKIRSMAGNDKTMRAFVRGAFIVGSYCVICVFVFNGFIWIFEKNVTFRPWSAEKVLWFFPWLLAGGVLGLSRHFYKERRVQFSVRLLLVITLLLSFSLAWDTLARSRYRGEQEAISAMHEKVVGIGTMSYGTFFSTVREMWFMNETLDSATIPFLINQLRLLPGLCRVNFSEDIISENDLDKLKDAFPDIAFVCE